MVIPLLIEVNPTRVTKSARIFLRAGIWRLVASSEGYYEAKLDSQFDDPPDGISFNLKSHEFNGPCYAQLTQVKSQATNLNILAESY